MNGSTVLNLCSTVEPLPLCYLSALPLCSTSLLYLSTSLLYLSASLLYLSASALQCTAFRGLVTRLDGVFRGSGLRGPPLTQTRDRSARTGFSAPKVSRDVFVWVQTEQGVLGLRAGLAGVAREGGGQSATVRQSRDCSLLSRDTTVSPSSVVV